MCTSVQSSRTYTLCGDCPIFRFDRASPHTPFYHLKLEPQNRHSRRKTAAKYTLHPRTCSPLNYQCVSSRFCVRGVVLSYFARRGLLAEIQVRTLCFSRNDCVVVGGIPSGRLGFLLRRSNTMSYPSLEESFSDRHHCVVVCTNCLLLDQSPLPQLAQTVSTLTLSVLSALWILPFIHYFRKR